MKNDLKAFFTATAIYVGLLIVGAILFGIDWLISEKYPMIDGLVRTFGIVYYLVLFSYILVRWLRKKWQPKQV